MNYCFNKFPNAICFDGNNATSEQAYQIKANQVKQGHLIILGRVISGDTYLCAGSTKMCFRVNINHRINGVTS